MPTITNVVATSSGTVTLSNPGVQTNPLLTWTWRSGKPVAGSFAVQPPTVTTYQMAAGYEPGDEAQFQRVAVTSRGVVTTGPVFGAIVPQPVTPPPPPPPAPVTLVTEPAVSGTLQAGDKLTATPGAYLNAVSVAQQWLSGTPASQGVLAGQTVVGTGLTYTLGTADVGNQITLAETATGVAGTAPLVDYVWGTTPVAAAVTPPPPPPPPVTGLVTGPFFSTAGSEPFNRKLPPAAQRVIDPLSTAMVSKYIGVTGTGPGPGGNVTDAGIATGSDGWPAYEAGINDTKITITGTSAYGTATLRCPAGVVAQTPAGGDGHLIIIEPVGVSPTHPTIVVETEFYQAIVKNGVIVGATGVQQFNASTNAPVNALTAQLLSEPGSARGCGSSCLDGLVLYSEFLAAYNTIVAGGRGVIPHALCCSPPWAQGLVNGQKVYRSPVAIIGSPGGPSDGVPYGACFDIDPTISVENLSIGLRVFAYTLQDFGCYVTDNTDENSGIGFQAQAAPANAVAGAALTSYLSFDGGQWPATALPWKNMRVLAHYTGLAS